MQSAVSILVSLVNSVAVMMVIGYVVTRSRLYTNILSRKITNRDRALLILIFGAFSIYGTLSGFKIMGAVANIRDLGPAIGGLMGGPLVGLGAGFIGGLHRYLQGGFTCEACSISTVAAGVAGGAFYLFRKGRLPTVVPSILLMVAIELFHMTMNLAISRPFAQAVALIKAIMVPMILANGLGMGLYAFIVKNLVRERSVEAAKQMIEGELKVARQIQMGIVPMIFPAFPERPEFEVYAVLEPAKEVGGDFYDFFFIDEDHLFFAVGDVSGKGVPASLFMAVTITLLRTKALRIDLNRVLASVNDDLSRENKTGMFVTLFCGILDTKTGDVEYCNGGHNPPYMCRADGSVEILDVPGDLVLGALDGVYYTKRNISLGRGDTLFLYTDGVTEAMDEHGGFYTDQRLAEALKETKALPANETVERILSGVHSFASGADQWDDITILALKYCR